MLIFQKVNTLKFTHTFLTLIAINILKVISGHMEHMLFIHQ